MISQYASPTVLATVHHESDSIIDVTSEIKRAGSMAMDEEVIEVRVIGKDEKTLADYIKESHETAKEKGWWDGETYTISCNHCGGDGCGYNQQGEPSTTCVVCGGTGSYIKTIQRPFSEGVALMHSELSEMLEEWRASKPMIYMDDPKSKPEGIAVEMADCMIRMFDWCGHMNIPLEEALRLKMAYNKTRSYRHGGKVA